LGTSIYGERGIWLVNPALMQDNKVQWGEIGHAQGAGSGAKQEIRVLDVQNGRILLDGKQFISVKNNQFIFEDGQYLYYDNASATSPPIVVV
jgi:hypothetical protein